MKSYTHKLSVNIAFLGMFISGLMILMSIVFIIANDFVELIFALIPCAIPLAFYSFKHIKNEARKYQIKFIKNLNKESYLIKQFGYNELDWLKIVAKFTKKNKNAIWVNLIILTPFIVASIGNLFNDLKLALLFAIISLLIGGVIVYLGKQAKKSQQKLTPNSPPKVRITINGIILGDKFIIPFNIGTGNLENCEIITCNDDLYLEFKIRRSGGGAHIYQYIEILIPEIYHNELETILKEILRRNGIV